MYKFGLVLTNSKEHFDHLDLPQALRLENA